MGFLAYSIMRKEVPVVETPIPGQKYYSLLTGQEVDKVVSERPILGIMIENSEEARPQTGLDSAGIVFETVTEGGITRYLALYQENMPEEVGPVRSVRPYFVDWLMGFDASVAHVGGSHEALEMMDNRNTKSLNQFYNEAPYYRRNDREAPHNMYARTKDLMALQAEKGHKTSKSKGFPRSDEAPSTQAGASTVTINYSDDIFQAQFRYDQPSNSYTRYLSGQPHIDAANNKPITVKNLIVIKMTGDIQALSEGEAILYKDGIAQTIKWKQSNFNKRIELIDEKGEEVPLNRGDSWFAVIPASGSAGN